MPLIGTFTARRSGHALNQALVRRLLADRATHEVVQIQADEELEPLQIRLPALGVPDVA
jgi:UDP-3-O-[3-hydroxymyristoyl] N-acetylglucosamine deacetylase